MAKETSQLDQLKLIHLNQQHKSMCFHSSTTYEYTVSAKDRIPGVARIIEMIVDVL